MAFPQTLVSKLCLHFIVFIICSQTHLSNSSTIHNINRKPTFHDHNPHFPIRPITDIHDLLPKYGLPKGLLPNNVESYSLADDGSFQVILEKPCYVQFDQLVYYEKVIRGKLKIGSVSDVSGIQAKKLFLWVSVTGMDADPQNGMVEFHVGVLSEKLPAEQFEVVPSCKNKACMDHEIHSKSI